MMMKTGEILKILWESAFTSCCGTVEQVFVAEGTLNTLSFNKKEPAFRRAFCPMAGHCLALV